MVFRKISHYTVGYAAASFRSMKKKSLASILNMKKTFFYDHEKTFLTLFLV